MEIASTSCHSRGYEMLRVDLERGATKPVEGDPWRLSFSTDFLQILETNKDVAKRVDGAFAMREIVDRAKERSTVTPSYAGNIALRAVHKRLFEQSGYPYTHREIGSWRDDIVDVIVHGTFEFDVSMRDVMSNISSRYATLLVLSETIGRRFTDKLNIVDVGASQNHGLKMMAGRPEFLQRPNTNGFGMVAFKQYMDLHPNFGQLVGIEKWVDSRTLELDSETKQWAKACSLPPHEMIDAERRQHYEELDSLKVDSVTMRMGEIGTKNFIDEDPSLRHSNHAVFLSTVMYQMSEEKREQALSQALDLLVDGGVLIVQDHMQVDSDGTMDFNINWKDKHILPYRTAIIDTAFPSRPLTEVFKWTDGRVHTGRVAGLKGYRALARLTK